mmetsp:Transcript_129834/g.375890  ORF Transcript_129834/g.375890 Transcript_129834/m.375890 type:complete len:397 (-) Transcript_129834:55-1245(-)
MPSDGSDVTCYRVVILVSVVLNVFIITWAVPIGAWAGAWMGAWTLGAPVVATTLGTPGGPSMPSGPSNSSTGACRVGDLDRLRNIARAGAQDEGPCSRVVDYLPAAWEKDFVENMKAYQSQDRAWRAGCKKVKSYDPLVKEWLRVAAAQLEGKAYTVTPLTTRALSLFRTTISCRGQAPRVVEEFVEPLAAVLRHPHFPCYTRDMPTIESKDYLLFGKREDTPLGRRFLFDLGASQYASGAGGASQRWFVESYRRYLGIEFDRILAWEYGGSEPERLRETPFEVLAKTSYFVIPASKEADACHNALNMIRLLCTREDFVVLKVDIDTPGVEAPLVKQLVADPDLVRLIDDFYWEDHVSGQPLAGKEWTGPFDHDLAESIKIFAALRAKGVRAHSWV